MYGEHVKTVVYLNRWIQIMKKIVKVYFTLRSCSSQLCLVFAYSVMQFCIYCVSQLQVIAWQTGCKSTSVKVH